MNTRSTTMTTKATETPIENQRSMMWRWEQDAQDFVQPNLNLTQQSKKELTFSEVTYKEFMERRRKKYVANLNTTLTRTTAFIRCQKCSFDNSKYNDMCEKCNTQLSKRPFLYF